MNHFEVLSNGMTIAQDDDLFQLGTDSMLLADFCLPLKGGRIADLGCGNGALDILLCAADAKCQVTGIEIQPRACEAARRNIEDNALAQRICLIPGDLRRIEALSEPNFFDVVVSNPPYFPVGSGAQPDSEAFAIARTECCCTPDDLCHAAMWLLRYGGRFCLVHRPERLAELCYVLKCHRLEPKRLRLVRHHPGAKASHILLESRLGGKPGLQIEPDLILFSEDGTPTREYCRIYHIP